ncbi:MAG TPA: glycosyltransferase family 39 protein [Methylomirabilota bacterium]|nr:glycosyltransferase family 39 protein [Methylomirabilota bacterium]
MVAGLLFLASAAFVWWRNAQVGVLVDIGYPLNTAMRIALGDVPYRDFPLAHSPGEFLIQALLIKVFGSHYLVQIAYASLLGGAATVITYLIVRRLLEGLVRSPGTIAAIAVLPLIPLGIYAILPNPFYDPDACLAVLITIALVLTARDRPSPRRLVVAGAVATLALFIKQNIGGAFLVALVGVLAVEASFRPERRRELPWLGLGIVGALAIEVALLQVVVGLDNFIHWTWTFALSGRGVATDRIREFADPLMLWPAALIGAFALSVSRIPPRLRVPIFVGMTSLAVAPWLAVTATVLGPPILFPPLLVLAAALGLTRAAREGPTFELLLPLVVLATTLGTLQSQGLFGSSYGIFPLLSLAIACAARDLAALVPQPRRLASVGAAIVALIATGSGAHYTLQNSRLDFIDVNAKGPVASSTYPSLAGLSARGPYIHDLDQMLFWVRDNVPAGDGLVLLPGEDPVYFALERKPGLPSVYFYDIATPYTPAEVSDIADRVGLRWVIVKDQLQMTTVPPLQPELVARLTERATLVTTVGPYRVFRR